MAPSGELVMACWDGSVAVVDSGTFVFAQVSFIVGYVYEIGYA